MESNRTRLNWKPPHDRPPEGLQEGGTITLSCSNCHKELVVIRITRPQEHDEYRLQAECCYCGDKSFEQTIRGGFHYKGAGRPDPSNPDLDIPETIIDDVDMDGSNFLFLTRKAQ